MPPPPQSMAVHADPPPPVVREPREFTYVTGSQLGKGGFAICHRGEVHKANKATGRVIALKIVKSKMEPIKLAQKFVTELQIHSKLQHPNIVEFYRAFSFEKSTYVVLEICDNGSLADALKKRKFFSMPEIRRFLIQTCGAVKYLHHRNIIHRDLKTGNLFLDKNMNIKVGDFGLAAVLMSQSDIGSRRTTLCGTPNYLAPEILEKGGKGHNEKVDLWAIGIIGYTLAVGRAPFHAAKREEIYAKLQARDYKWPELSKTQNEITDDLRDLVSSLLVHEDDRPNPDRIVSHPFFKLPFVPLHLDASYTSKQPKWSNNRPPSPETIKKGYSDAWFKLCGDSGVGEYAPGKYFPVCGGRKIRSVVRDCEKELALGRQPIVPMPEGMVYVPYPDRDNVLNFGSGQLSEITEEKESSAEGRHLAESKGNVRVAKSTIRQVAKAEVTAPLQENVDPVETTQPERANTTKVRRIPSVRKVPLARETAAAPQRPARSVRGVQRTAPTRKISESKSTTASTECESKEPVKQEEVATKSTMLVQKLPAHTTQRKTHLHNGKEAAVNDFANVPVSQIVGFRENISRAISKRSWLGQRPAVSGDIPFVTKWVDYSKKHGVGYVLEDGSIGIALNGSARYPVTHIVVRDGYSRLQSIADKPASLDSIPAEFYVDGGDAGIKVAHLERERQRSTTLLWSKFAKYMCQQLGQNDILRPKGADGEGTSTFVKFYQRLENVGVWGFENGAFQFNFPDHTKLAFSPDGTRCNFTCLSIEAAQHLAQNGDLPFNFIRQRHVLSASLRTLIHGSSAEAASLKDVTEANLLRKKLHFIVRILDEWVSSGGIGRLGDNPELLKWDGPWVDDGKRKEWVTVGRYGGDDARE